MGKISENFNSNKVNLLEHNTILFDSSGHVPYTVIISCIYIIHVIWSWSWSFNSFCFILVSHTDMIFSALRAQV
jgi:hypothetical protein